MELAVLVYEPLARGGDFIRQLSNTTWSHRSEASGGWREARCSFAANQFEIADWYEFGLGRRILLTGGGGVWFEGFVNEVRGVIGNATVVRGPLMEVCNRVVAFYSPPDEAGNVTDRYKTPAVQDTVSIARYGAFERIVSMGTVDAEEAEQAAGAFCYAYAHPPASVEIVENTQPSTIEITVLGYIEWLKAYSYFYENAYETVSASDKIMYVLADDPNDFIVLDPFRIQENTLQVNANEDYSLAATIIEDVVLQGGANYGRWVAGIYEDRVFFYEPAPTSYSYVMRVSDKGSVLQTPDGIPVNPWEVRAGKWVYLPDLMPAAGQMQTTNSDPRFLFIESLEYTSPRSLTLETGISGSARERLRASGLMGV